MHSLIKMIVVLVSAVTLGACFGPPSISEEYHEVSGPVASGCLNRHLGLEDLSRCSDYELNGVILSASLRGDRKYYQDPQKAPYHLAILMCGSPNANGNDVRDLLINKVLVKTNSGKKFESLSWRKTGYNDHCRYFPVSPKLEINVEQDSQVTVFIQVVSQDVSIPSKAISFTFSGDSHWHLPFYGP